MPAEISTGDAAQQEQHRFPAIALAALFCGIALAGARYAPPAETDWLVQFVRLTARISLLWFMVSFAMEPALPKLSRGGYAGFLTTHGIHLMAIAIAVAEDRIRIEAGPIVVLLGLGAASLPLIGMRAGNIQSLRRLQDAAIYFVWFLFTATYVSRLIEPVQRAPHSLLIALLAVAISAIGLRLVMARRPNTG